MHCTVAVTLLLLISSVSSTSDEVNGILKFLFKNSKYLPRDIKIPKSEKYPEIDLTTVRFSYRIYYLFFNTYYFRMN